MTRRCLALVASSLVTLSAIPWLPADSRAAEGGYHGTWKLYVKRLRP